jgi:hypothetical protein
MARESMSALISDVRSKIGDPVGDDAVFTDDEIERALDERKRVVSYSRLDWYETYAPLGSTTYGTFYTGLGGGWEDNVEIVDASYNVVTPSSANLIRGEWVFDPPLLNSAVLFRGSQYDVYGACADLLTQMLAKAKNEFSFSRGNRSFQRSDKVAHIEKAIDRYRGMQWVGFSPIY